MPQAPQQDLCQVEAFTYEAEAQTAQLLLEQNGIESEVRDAGVLQADAFLSNAVGGVKLLVKTSDVARAKEILAQDEKTRRANYAKTCYLCESSEVVRVPVTWKVIALGVLTLGMYFPAFFRHYKCNKCGKRLSHFNMA